MDRTPTEHELGLLRGQIERTIGRRVSTPRDFRFLRECIYARLHEYLSESTLKRVWGYMQGGEVRVTTLNLLASFIGYSSWGEFTRLAFDNPEPTSLYILGRHIDVDTELELGRRVIITWAPGRKCRLRYLGGRRFEVEASEQTRLREGDTFVCGLMIEGEPLYLDSLRQNGRPPVGYVCGKLSGIRFELPDNPENNQDT